MKKILFAICAVALIFNACEKDTNNTDDTDNVSITLSKNSITESTFTSTPKEVSFTVTNSSDNSTTINWERASTNAPAGFKYMVNGATANAGSMELKAKEVATITLKVDPDGKLGEAIGTISFYDVADQANTTKVFNYNISYTTYFTIAPQGLMTDAGPNSVRKEYHINVINPNSTSVDIVWEKRDGSTNSSDWEIVVCDNVACWTTAVVKKTMTIAGMDTVDFKVLVDPKSVTGIGDVDAVFYVQADSAVSYKSQLITHTANK